MKKEICECCKGNPIQPNTKALNYTYTYECPFCNLTGFITYKWWEWILLSIYRRMQDIDSRQIRRR